MNCGCVEGVTEEVQIRWQNAEKIKDAAGVYRCINE